MSNPNKGKYEKINDEHLMKSIHHGDTGAFNELYGRYNRRLSYYFYRMLGNSSEKAQDFLQDIFIKIIERPELFDASRKFSTWVFSVAHNMCKNEYRRMAVRGNLIREDNVDLYAGINETELRDMQLTADQIFMEIDNLGETEKTAFILYYREDFSLQEIGKVLALPEGTVKSKLFYARKKLCRKLLINETK
jgi:RNA polymerase sigma-70 factor (ECF subfamily)